MRRWGLATILLLGLTEPSLAWEYNSCEDPLTDQKCATLIHNGTISGSPVTLGMKCWETNEVHLQLILPVAYDHAATYEMRIAAEVRIDRNEKFPLVVVPRETAGEFALAHVALSEKDLDGIGLGQVLRELRKAKTRLVFGVNSQAIVFSVAGAAKPLQRFLTRCVIDLDKRKATGRC